MNTKYDVAILNTVKDLVDSIDDFNNKDQTCRVSYKAVSKLYDLVVVGKSFGDNDDGL